MAKKSNTVTEAFRAAALLRSNGMNGSAVSKKTASGQTKTVVKVVRGGK